MHILTFNAAKNAFNQDPTSRTAWNYLVTAVEYATEDRIDQQTFLHAIRDIANYIDGSSRTRALVERLLLVWASISLACVEHLSPAESPDPIQGRRAREDASAR
jgi:hypothetical protein